MAHTLSGLSRKSLEQIPEIPSRRIEAMPFGAIVLERLIAATGAKRVVTSSYGVREGVLYEALSDAQVASDPLLEAAADLNLRQSRSPGHAPELARWLEPVIAAWPDRFKRLARASTFITDSGWRAHPDYRARQSFERVLTLPVAGLTHEDRAFLALSIFERYGGNAETGPVKWACRFLDEEDLKRARALGRACRLAYNLSGAVAGLLPLTSLELDDDRITLTLNGKRGSLSGESVEKRLSALASHLKLKSKVTSG